MAGTTHANPSRIYAAGYTSTPTSNYDALLCVYSISGTLDGNFGGGDGIVSTPIGDGQDEIHEMIVDSSRIIVTGYARKGDEAQNLMLARFFSSTGALDTSLDGDGILLDDVGNATSLATAMTRQPDGGIVLAGYSHDVDKCALARLLPNGSPDSSFSGDGKATFSVVATGQYLTGVALQPDLRIVAAGTALLATGYSMLLARCLPNGSLDPAFNGTGILTTSLGIHDYDPSVTVQPDGRILLAGTSQGQSDSSYIRVSRYLSTGLKDTSFGVNGHLRLKAGTYFTAAGGLALQPDGRIVLACWRKNPLATTVEAVVLRLTSTGALDPTFGTGGLVVPMTLSSPSDVTDVLVQPDGRIVVTGYITSGLGNRDPWLLRLNGNGQPDATFGTQGYQVVSTSPVDETALCVAIQADGRLLVAGRTGTDNVNDQFVARAVTTGAPDNSFGGDGSVAVDCGAGGGDMAYDIEAGGSGPILVAGAADGLMCVMALESGPAQSGVGEAPPARAGLAVGQPWPSPTRAGMSIPVSMAEPAVVTANLIDVGGRLIRSLASAEPLAAGTRWIAWDGRDGSGSPVAAGMYFVRIQVSDRVVTRRVVVVR